MKEEAMGGEKALIGGSLMTGARVDLVALPIAENLRTARDDPLHLADLLEGETDPRLGEGGQAGLHEGEAGLHPGREAGVLHARTGVGAAQGSAATPLLFTNGRVNHPLRGKM